jgi:hypothetical protein
VRLIGERSYDQGGPFKDLLEVVCSEILVRFFKLTSNSLHFDSNEYEPLD